MYKQRYIYKNIYIAKQYICYIKFLLGGLLGKKKCLGKLRKQTVIKNQLRNTGLMTPPIKKQAAPFMPILAEPLITHLLHFLSCVSSKSII